MIMLSHASYIWKIIVQNIFSTARFMYSKAFDRTEAWIDINDDATFKG